MFSSGEPQLSRLSLSSSHPQACSDRSMCVVVIRTTPIPRRMSSQPVTMIVQKGWRWRWRRKTGKQWGDRWLAQEWASVEGCLAWRPSDSLQQQVPVGSHLRIPRRPCRWSCWPPEPSCLAASPAPPLRLVSLLLCLQRTPGTRTHDVLIFAKNLHTLFCLVHNKKRSSLTSLCVFIFYFYTHPSNFFQHEKHKPSSKKSLQSTHLLVDKKFCEKDLEQTLPLTFRHHIYYK